MTDWLHARPQPPTQTYPKQALSWPGEHSANIPRAASATGAPRPHTAAVDRCVASLPPSAWGGGGGGGGGGGLLEMRPFSGGAGMRSGSGSRLGSPLRPSSSSSSSSSTAATRFVAAGGAVGALGHPPQHQTLTRARARARASILTLTLP